MIVEAALVLVVALWQLGPSMAAGSGPRLAMDMLAGNSVTCDQGELVGIVEDVELLSIGHSKNVYRGVLKRRDSMIMTGVMTTMTMTAVMTTMTMTAVLTASAVMIQ